MAPLRSAPLQTLIPSFPWIAVGWSHLATLASLDGGTKKAHAGNPFSANQRSHHHHGHRGPDDLFHRNCEASNKTKERRRLCKGNINTQVEYTHYFVRVILQFFSLGTFFFPDKMWQKMFPKHGNCPSKAVPFKT